MRTAKWRLLLAFGLVGYASSYLLAQTREELQSSEASLLAEVKAQGIPAPEYLSALGRIREQLGKFEVAIDTWGLLKKLHGDKEFPNESSAPDYTCAQVADFWVERIRRKQHLAAHPPRRNVMVPPKPRDALLQARRDAITARGKDGQIDLLVQADLDGDLIDELLIVGKHGPLGQRHDRFMYLAKWKAGKYEIVWRDEGKHTTKLFPFSFKVVDSDGDGWKEIGVGFEPETDNAARLYFNGVEAMMLSR